MKKLFLAAFCGLFCLGATDPVGCECGPVPPDDGGTADAADAGHVTADASADATVADTAGTDTIGHDGGLDASLDAGDPCADYYWLQDGQEWNCTGSGTFTCVWTNFVVVGDDCKPICENHFYGDYYVNNSIVEITPPPNSQVHVRACTDCTGEWTCTPP